LLKTPAKLDDIMLQAGEELPLHTWVDVTQPLPMPGTSHEYQFSAQQYLNGGLVGGVDYAIVTRALETDSDGDGIPDVNDTDNDNDSMADTWEVQYGLNPLNAGDATEDADGDGVSNVQEHEQGSDPSDAASHPDLYTPQGIVNDKLGQPIANATVEVGDITTFTDAAGHWIVPDLLAGIYPLTISKDNYLCTGQVIVDENLPQVSCTPVQTLKATVKPSVRKQVAQGSELTYLITVFNGGVQTATGITLSQVLPASAQVIALQTSGGGGCQIDTRTCTLPDLGQGEKIEVQLTVQLEEADPDFVNSLTLISNEYPVDVVKTKHEVKPYLSVSISDQPDPVAIKGQLHYQVQVELSAYSPQETATDVEVKMILPQGTELLSFASEHATCHPWEQGLVCTMDDLSIATPSSLSQVAIDLDVALTDGGLLLLNHEAQVTAPGFSAHTARERTKIFVGDAVVDIILVIDTTGSMQGEIDGVIKALTDFIAQIDLSQSPSMALVEFKDTVRVSALTYDPEVLLKAVQRLKAQGGGLCPEASVEALNLALDHIKTDGTLFFTTDASPYEDADIDALLDRLQNKRVKLDVILSGDCSMPQSLNQLTQ
jgi:uncharacterized repeat protein (TIGR01451 family)